MLRVIQTGILICLVAITGLLFAIYRQQAALTATGSSQQVNAEQPIVELAGLEQIQAPVAEQSEPVKAIEVAPEPPTKPRPLARSSVAAPAPKPKPQPRPQPEQAPSAAVESAPVEPALTVTAVEAEKEESPGATQEIARDAETRFAEPLREETPVVAPEPREPRVVTVPAGLRLAVRIDNTLSTSRNRADDTFFATLDEPVIVDGLIIADKGARLQGRIIESQQAGRVKGLARLACELTHLDTDDGQRIPIQTSTFAMDGPSGGKEDLKKVAMGAGAGAILGAIFGGGKGAAIGAASGAGAGAGTAAITRGEPAVIEPETRIEFRLSEGVSITEKL